MKNINAIITILQESGLLAYELNHGDTIFALSIASEIESLFLDNPPPEPILKIVK
tara:strand:+ start:13207 stop:13371 length:165 start_codon:yes stop_codon:yes gene_type:complete